MFFEGTALSKRFVAHFALKGSFSRVDPTMRLQSAWVSERLVAHLALVGPFSSMGVEMVLEGPGGA